MLNEISPRKRRRIQRQNYHVSDDDRVSVMASDEFDEAEEEAQPQEDYSSRIFNPETVNKDKWGPSWGHCKLCKPTLFKDVL